MSSDELEMNGRLLVVGALNVDMVVTAPTLPGPGETVVGGNLQRFGGGKGGNAAVAASRAGVQVRYIGAVGADELGSEALEELRHEKVDISGVAKKSGFATGTALIVVDATGENQIVVAAGANAAVTAQDVLDAAKQAAGWTDCLLVSTEISMAAVTAAVEISAENGWVCVLNPAPVLSGIRPLLELGPILTPNQGELGDLYRLIGQHGDPSVEEQAAKITEFTKAPVVVTMGSNGVLVCHVDGTSVHIPARTVKQVVDTTGAGDTFNGVFAASLALGESITMAARRGVAAATLSVESAGARTSSPTAAAIDQAVAAAIS